MEKKLLDANLGQLVDWISEAIAKAEISIEAKGKGTTDAGTGNIAFDLLGEVKCVKDVPKGLLDRKLQHISKDDLVAGIGGRTVFGGGAPLKIKGTAQHIPGSGELKVSLESVPAIAVTGGGADKP